ncbi:hypothetical protein PO878_14010 [Iamia majanohamensis]|uniref:DUF1109 domain-containing protein n=1 Tax=Iamia majanohamensis TaxID=467976 RepID=A0AAE9Y397_9ACTN|nr:hypothetical protein [Iamia majanohamensis]WCO65615.1 hypothetical protein PO878_14010 [Iamia majanohamensis]
MQDRTALICRRNDVAPGAGVVARATLGVVQGGEGPATGADPASRGDDRAAGWDEATGWARLLGQPPRWFFHLVLLVPVAVVLWGATSPYGAFLPLVFGAGGIVLLAGVWLARAVAFAAASLRRPRSARWLAVAPIAGVVVVALMVADVPLRLRWAQSRPAFEEVVATVDADDEAPVDDDPTVAGFPRRLGSYEVTSVLDWDGGTAFVEADGGFIDDTGFVHLPDGPDALSDQQRVGFVLDLRHLEGDWYTFTLHN